MANVDSALEEVGCPFCERRAPFRVLRPSAYPAAPTAEWLSSHYSASSDAVLFDQVVCCRGCETIYLNPRPRADVIMGGYTEAVDPTFVSQDRLRIRTFRRNLRGVTRSLGVRGRRLRIVDVGCAGGAFVAAATLEGHEAEGIEPSAALGRSARERHGCTVHTGTLDTFPGDAGSYDLVTLWDVLEHVSDVHAALQRARELLRPDGAIVVSYPAWDSLARRGLGWRWPFFLSVHLTYFTKHTLRAFLLQDGFTAPRETPLRQTLEAGYVVKRGAKVLPVFAPMAALIGKTPATKIPFSYYMGQRIAVARVAS